MLRTKNHPQPQQHQHLQQRSSVDSSSGGAAAGDFVANAMATDVDGIVAMAAANKAARKEKTSRRTTSLLNIFMSNVQGKGHSTLKPTPLSLFYFSMKHMNPLERLHQKHTQKHKHPQVTANAMGGLVDIHPLFG